MHTFVPSLEIGGTHISAALVDASTWQLTGHVRTEVDGAADAASILDAWAAAAESLGAAPNARWGVAMPDPFDYAHGIARFRDVGKFESLDGVDVGAELAHRLGGGASFVFCNDADAFVLGEWTLGAAQGYARCVGVTLGTGLGSGWLVDGRITTDEPGVPELGRARTLQIDGVGLEDVVSIRGIRAAYTARGGDPGLDVRGIAELARRGDPTASAALDAVFDALGRGIGPALRTFRAEVVVIGGSIARSWDLVEPAFRRGLDWPDAPPVELAAYPDDAALRGAARATE